MSDSVVTETKKRKQPDAAEVPQNATASIDAAAAAAAEVAASALKQAKVVAEGKPAYAYDLEWIAKMETVSKDVAGFAEYMARVEHNSMSLFLNNPSLSGHLTDFRTHFNRGEHWIKYIAERKLLFTTQGIYHCAPGPDFVFLHRLSSENADLLYRFSEPLTHGTVKLLDHMEYIFTQCLLSSVALKEIHFLLRQIPGNHTRAALRHEVFAPATVTMPTAAASSH